MSTIKLFVFISFITILDDQRERRNQGKTERTKPETHWEENQKRNGQGRKEKELEGRPKKRDFPLPF
jgi:hypothetical protein